MATVFALLLSLPFVRARQVSISINASQQFAELPPIARFFGCDEANYAYYPDGQALLSDLGHLGPHQTYFRTHNLLTTCDPSDAVTPRLKWGCTNAYTEDAAGNAIYNWTVIDRIFDAYLANGVKPYAQIGFMPKVLATDAEPYTFAFEASSPYDDIYTGWSHVPSNWHKWGELVYQWVAHEVRLRGVEEVESWYWEVWNEPNIPYWNGTAAQYFTLYDYAVANVRRALPTARVGGPEVAGGPGGTFLQDFLQHTLAGPNAATGATGAPLDFLSFHAKGSPLWLNATASAPAHLQMNLSASLQNVRDAFALITTFPSLKTTPVIIGEDDPDGCAACESPAYGYRNGLVYPSYTAAVFARDLELARAYGVQLQGALTWAFEYDGHAYFDGFRVLATNGVAKPILNVFRMFGLLTGSRVGSMSSGQVPLDNIVAESVRGEADVGVLASFNRTEKKLAAMMWHYHDDDLPKPDARVCLEVSGLDAVLTTQERGDGASSPHGGSVLLTHYRIDSSHSNAYTVWQAMGSPQIPSREQYAALQAAGMLQVLGRPERVAVTKGRVEVEFELPIHAVSLVVVEL
ncbi:hypothetical protein LTR08_003778 [Meristemomyces frigidus]|nr:hypothetical protein LTR08_003778 [Meristemomyces frigidus]